VVRRKRDNATAEERALAQGELREAQKRVRSRAAEVKAIVTNRRNNVLLKCNSKNPSVYWDMLKRTVGLKRKKVAIPDEVLFDGVVARGDSILEVWKEAFRKLSAVDKDEKTFKAQFLEQIQQEVKTELSISQQFDSLNTELNDPIKYEEVTGIIAKLNQGKAAGIDAMINEIFKFGGEGICKATARLCEELFRIERIPKDWARGLNDSFLSSRMGMPEFQTITAASPC
jgi:hypothetical protein